MPLFGTRWLGSIVSNIGNTGNDTAAVWTMTTLTGSATMVSMMQTMSSLPMFLFALPAGKAGLADFRKEHSLVFIQSTMNRELRTTPCCKGNDICLRA